MKSVKYFLCFVIAVLLTAVSVPIAYAASVNKVNADQGNKAGQKHVYIPKGLPEEQYHMSGLYIGVGAAGAVIQGKASITTQNRLYNQQTGQLVGTDFFLRQSHCDTIFNLAPSVIIGYWGDARGYYQTQYSLSFLYQYVDTMEHLKSLINTNSGWHEVDLHIKHQLAFLLQTGKNTEYVFFHIGLGPVIFLTQYCGSISFLNSPTIHLNDNQILWGGMALAGTSFYLSKQWTLDTSISYSLSQTKSLSRHMRYSGSNAGVNYIGVGQADYKSCFSVVELMLTLNRSF